MSNINERNGKLFFDFRYRGVRCREYTSLTDSAANRRRMELVMGKIEQEIARNSFDYGRYFPNSSLAARFKVEAAAVAASTVDTSPLFGVFIREWFHDKSVEWRRSYSDSVEHILAKHLNPTFGEIPLGSIDRASILAFRAKLAGAETGQDAKKLKPATVNRILGILSMALDEAALRYSIPSPFVSISRLKIQRGDIQPFSMAEVQLLIDHVRPDYSDYLLFRMFTGLRSGEANGLKWEYVDFERREVRIRETYVRGRTEYTKTDGSQREIHMSQPVYEALQRMHGTTSTLGTYVFCNRNGLPIDNHNFTNRIWKPLLRHLDLKQRRPYQMRHTCATLWLSAGENPEWIARQLGHTTTEMLFRVYSRYVPNLTRRDGSAFDNMLTAAMNGGIKATTDFNQSSQETRHA